MKITIVLVALLVASVGVNLWQQQVRHSLLQSQAETVRSQAETIRKYQEVIVEINYLRERQRENLSDRKPYRNPRFDSLEKWIHILQLQIGPCGYELTPHQYGFSCINVDRLKGQ